MYHCICIFHTLGHLTLIIIFGIDIAITSIYNYLLKVTQIKGKLGLHPGISGSKAQAFKSYVMLLSLKNK